MNRLISVAVVVLVPLLIALTLWLVLAKPF